MINEQDDQPNDPVRNIEKRKDLRRDLDEQPGHHGIGQPRRCKHGAALVRLKKLRAFIFGTGGTAVPIPETTSGWTSRRAFGSADHSAADRTSDRAGGAQE